MTSRSVSGDLLVKIGLVGIAIGALYLVGKRAAQLSCAALDSVNPLSTNNIIYGAVNALVPDPNGTGETLGTWVYGVANNQASQKAMSSTAPANNIFYGGANAIVQKNTGTDATIGTLIYDIFHPGG